MTFPDNWHRRAAAVTETSSLLGKSTNTNKDKTDETEHNAQFSRFSVYYKTGILHLTSAFENIVWSNTVCTVNVR